MFKGAMDEIQIDYINGTHGSFLMHVINNLVNNSCIEPFVKHHAGSAHKLIPYKNKIAIGRHYSVWNEKNLLKNVVSITVEDDDMLMLTELLMHRWNHFDPDELDTNTFYKIYKSQYSRNLMKIYDGYGIQPKSNIPRYILRDYFKYNLDPDFYSDSLGESFNLILANERKTFDYSNLDVKLIEFKFKWFYDYNEFKNGITLIKDFFNLEYTDNEDTLHRLHTLFLENNPAIGMNSVYTILEQIKNNIEVEIPKLRLLQEAWLNLQVEKLTNKSMFTVDYFTNTAEIYEHLSKQKSNVNIEKPVLVTI